MNGKRYLEELKQLEGFCREFGYGYHVICEGYPEIYAPREVTKQRVANFVSRYESTGKYCSYSYPPFRIHVPTPMPEHKLKSEIMSFQCVGGLCKYCSREDCNRVGFGCVGICEDCLRRDCLCQ